MNTKNPPQIIRSLLTGVCVCLLDMMSLQRCACIMYLNGCSILNDKSNKGETSLFSVKCHQCKFHTQILQLHVVCCSDQLCRETKTMAPF